MSLTSRALAAAGCLAVVIAIPTTTTAEPDDPAPGPHATFEGSIIDLREDWGEAHACRIDLNESSCYRTEQEMDEANAAETGEGVSEETLFAACATSVRLYDGTSFGGDMISLSTRGTWLSLSTYGFSARTSSYKIGACSSVFRDGGGVTYPGNTSANAQATSMAAGWNNRVTLVFIN